MNKFKKGDVVIVRSGRDAGKVSIISRVFPKTFEVILESAGFVTKHIKPNQQSKGGIKQILKRLSWSSISHYDESEKESFKISFSIKSKGKVRVSKSSSKELSRWIYEKEFKTILFWWVC